MDRIEILLIIGCEDKTRTQKYICTSTNTINSTCEKPIYQFTISKIEQVFFVKDLFKGNR